MESNGCKYCVPDRDGCVDGLDRMAHAYITFHGGYHIFFTMMGKGLRIPTNYCPMCGRKLTVGK